MNFDRSTYSGKILIVIGIFYTLNFMMEGKLAELFVLTPSIINENFEFWRLLTFPLAPGSVEAVLLFIFTFYIIYDILALLIAKVNIYIRKGHSFRV